VEPKQAVVVADKVVVLAPLELIVRYIQHKDAQLSELIAQLNQSKIAHPRTIVAESTAFHLATWHPTPSSTKDACRQRPVVPQ